MKNIIIKSDKRSNVVKYIIGGVIFIMAIFSAFVAMPVLFLIAAVIFTLKSGIEIDKTNNKIRSFSSALGIKSGKWINYDIFKVITIKKVKKGSKRYGGRGPTSIINIEHFYDVYLSSENFRKKMLIFSTKDITISKQFADEWSEKLELPLVKYAPIPSQKTQQRRR